MFKGIYADLMDPIPEVYNKGLASKTLQEKTADLATTCREELKFIIPQELTLE